MLKFGFSGFTCMSTPAGPYMAQMAHINKAYRPIVTEASARSCRTNAYYFITVFIYFMYNVR